MKRTVLYISLCLATVLTACSKDTEDKLEGKWQLREVTAGGITEKVDTVFYNFQTSVFMLQVYDKASDKYSHIYGMNTLQDNNISIQWVSHADSILVFLPLTDWESSQRTFSIEKVTGSRLILSDDGKQYTFRKF